MTPEALMGRPVGVGSLVDAKEEEEVDEVEATALDSTAVTA